MFKTIILYFLFLTIVQPAFATSFDCRKASTSAEKKICTVPELMVLDDKLAEAYKRALKASSDSIDLKKKQRNWLKSRNTCENADCFATKYSERIKSLQRIAAGPVKMIIPPYPDIWGRALPWPAENVRNSYITLYHTDSGDLLASYVSEKKSIQRKNGTCCDTKLKHSKLLFFSGVESTMKVYLDQRIDSSPYMHIPIKFDDGSTITPTKAYYSSIFGPVLTKKNASGEVLEQKMVLYLRDKAKDSPFSEYSESAIGMGDKFLQRVEAEYLALVKLEDETFIAYTPISGNLIIRFDKDFNTKFRNRHVFVVNVSEIEALKKEVSKTGMANYQTMDDAIANYLTQLRAKESE